MFVAEAADLKDQGYLERQEVARQVAELLRVNFKYASQQINPVLSRYRMVWVNQGYVLLPDDRTWFCLYNAALPRFIAAYYTWHGRFKRVHAVDADNFFKAYFAGESWALAYIPAPAPPRTRVPKKGRHLRAVPASNRRTRHKAS